jgi:hypothetical protein
VTVPGLPKIYEGQEQDNHFICAGFPRSFLYSFWAVALLKNILEAGHWKFDPEPSKSTG